MNSPKLTRIENSPLDPRIENLPRDPRIIIVGAGMAGIATAAEFLRSGYTQVTVLEKGNAVGGVWHWNRYPGLTCDVPSQIYQYSFATNPQWQHIWATGTDIAEYHRTVAKETGVDKLVRFNSEVTEARFTGLGWQIQTSADEKFECEFLIMATGVLHHPFKPDIPGLHNFAGDVVHTAEWTADIETDNKRIAVIGSGSTGVQVISALQPSATKILHFSRSPQWVLWAPMGLAQPKIFNNILERFPTVAALLHQRLLWAAGILADIATKPSWRRRLVQRYARASLRLQVKDRVLREKLTPDYQPLCKRQVISGTYYRAVSAENAEVITDKIIGVTADAIQTADGQEHPVDIIVLATGFSAHNYMRPMNIVGREGITIDDAWKSGPRAYRMTAIPGFPNMFTVLGPNSPSGSIPLQYSAELTARYLVQWLAKYRAGEINTVEVREDATAQFIAAAREALKPTVWNTGCHSWYFTEEGAIDLWPWNRATMTAMLSVPDLEHFDID